METNRIAEPIEDCMAHLCDIDRRHSLLVYLCIQCTTTPHGGTTRVDTKTLVTVAKDGDGVGVAIATGLVVITGAVVVVVVAGVAVATLVVVVGFVGFAGPFRVTPTATPTITPITTNIPTIIFTIPFVWRYHGIDFHLVTSFE